MAGASPDPSLLMDSLLPLFAATTKTTYHVEGSMKYPEKLWTLIQQQFYCKLNELLSVQQFK